MVNCAEAKRIERRYRPRAHGKNIPQNTADPRGGALIRLDKRWMVVALHLESHGKTASDIDHAGVLARTLQHMASFGGQVFEIVARALVAAVLRPHDGEYTELGVIRLASGRFDDFFIFISGEVGRES